MFYGEIKSVVDCEEEGGAMPGSRTGRVPSSARRIDEGGVVGIVIHMGWNGSWELYSG